MVTIPANELTTKAVVLPDFGAAPELRQLPVSEPAEGEVRVRVHAASVNGFDVANGMVKGMMEHRFPVVLGKDFAGTVEAVGAGVAGFAPGARVFGVVTRPCLGDGSFGEFVTIPAGIGLARLPDGIDIQKAGALGLAGTTARLTVDAAEVLSGLAVAVASGRLSPNDRPARGTIRSGFLGRDKVGSAMTRADIATFLVGQLTDDRYRRATPVISN